MCRDWWVTEPITPHLRRAQPQVTSDKCSAELILSADEIPLDADGGYLMDAPAHPSRWAAEMRRIARRRAASGLDAAGSSSSAAWPAPLRVLAACFTVTRRSVGESCNIGISVDQVLSNGGVINSGNEVCMRLVCTSLALWLHLSICGPQCLVDVADCLQRP